MLWEGERFMHRFGCALILIAFVLINLLCACGNGGDEMNVELSLLDESIIELSSNVYESSQLNDIADFRGSIDELNEVYPIECLRKVDGLYRASYLGDDGVCVVLFDESGNSLFGRIYNTQLKKDDFALLSIGESVDSVKKIDPDGDYAFLNAGRNDFPKTSTHCTKDGYMITVRYSELSKIIGIETELI